MIIGSGRHKTSHSCPSCVIDYRSNDFSFNGTIPEYYSEQHAKDCGWRKTKDIMFCSPDQEFVWVCPKCWPKETG